MTTASLEVYQHLLQTLGPQEWWPGETPCEVMLGAVLVQNTNWKNVEKALDNLRDADVLDPQRIAKLSQTQLQELIRPAGYFRIKATRLHNLVNFFVDHFDGSIEAMRSTSLDQLREMLLSVHGIGPETADSILCYAMEMTSLVVDTYTLRIFARHGWVDYDSDYHQLQEHIANELPLDVTCYNEFHALMVKVGQQFCRKTPHCDECPLRDMLPEGGIVEPLE